MKYTYDIRHGYETQGRLPQKSKTGVLVIF